MALGFSPISAAPIAALATIPALPRGQRTSHGPPLSARRANIATGRRPTQTSSRRPRQ